MNDNEETPTRDVVVHNAIGKLGDPLEATLEDVVAATGYIANVTESIRKSANGEPDAISVADRVDVFGKKLAAFLRIEQCDEPLFVLTVASLLLSTTPNPITSALAIQLLVRGHMAEQAMARARAQQVVEDEVSRVDPAG